MIPFILQISFTSWLCWVVAPCAGTVWLCPTPTQRPMTVPHLTTFTSNASLSLKTFFSTLNVPGKSCRGLAAPPRSVYRTSLWPSWSGSRQILRWAGQSDNTPSLYSFRRTTSTWSPCSGRWLTITRGSGPPWSRDIRPTSGPPGPQWSGRCRCCWAPPGTRGWRLPRSSTSRTRGPSPPRICSGEISLTGWQ